mmetsp:Transcript_4515/g.14206  ORF Transcript_4515/g.14206 Transcript_4515/m.14206 type:complete len:255 (-) Transcript_4515:69-833(-)
MRDLREPRDRPHRRKLKGVFHVVAAHELLQHLLHDVLDRVALLGADRRVVRDAARARRCRRGPGRSKLGLLLFRGRQHARHVEALQVYARLLERIGRQKVGAQVEQQRPPRGGGGRLGRAGAAGGGQPRDALLALPHRVQCCDAAQLRCGHGDRLSPAARRLGLCGRLGHQRCVCGGQLRRPLGLEVTREGKAEVLSRTGADHCHLAAEVLARGHRPMRRVHCHPQSIHRVSGVPLELARARRLVGQHDQLPDR